MKTMLITGANRGIGFNFTKQYAKDGWRVLATCRDPKGATDLQALKNEFSHITLYALDITSFDAIDALAKQVQHETIHHFINNAGIYGKSGERFGTVASDNMLRVFTTNAVAPFQLVQALIEPIARSEDKLIINVSSRMGSIGENDSGNAYAYRTSKAALNCLMKSVAIDLAPKGIKVLMLHPGWVKTRMGGDDALISPEESVRQMREVIKAHGATARGEFWSYKGERLPW